MNECLRRVGLWVLVAVLAGGCSRQCEDKPQTEQADGSQGAAAAVPAAVEPAPEPEAVAEPEAMPTPSPADTSTAPAIKPPAAPARVNALPVPADDKTLEKLAQLDPEDKARQLKLIEMQLPEVRGRLNNATEQCMELESKIRRTDPVAKKLYKDLVDSQIAYRQAINANPDYGKASQAKTDAMEQYRSLEARRQALMKENRK